MKKLTIDRFEGNYAVCEQEDKTTINIPKYKLPLECKEGDTLYQDSEGMYRKDIETTKSREKRIYDKINRLFE
jgi:hypothetical protein